MPFEDIAAAVQIAFTYFTIIYLTGLGGLFSERSGIVNIGLEGMMIIGTVTGSFGDHYFSTKLGWGLPWGPIAGPAVRCWRAAPCSRSIHAVATITFRVDQIVSGVVINLVAVGLARFLSTLFFGQATQSDPGGPTCTSSTSRCCRISRGVWAGRSGTVADGAGRPSCWSSPCTFVLYRTRWGLRLRSCGENPEATRSLGVAVAPLRYVGVLLSGAFAGLSGAFLAVEVVNNWREGQTLGLGFISLAALILSNWNPIRLMCGGVPVRLRPGDPAAAGRRARDPAHPATSSSA